MADVVVVGFVVVVDVIAGRVTLAGGRVPRVVALGMLTVSVCAGLSCSHL